MDETTTIAGETTPRCVASALQAGELPPDRAFDQFLPPALQIVSKRHWTPLAVAVFAALWLEQRGVRHVVDIGSGAGKFCIVGALVTRLRFTGIEQRAALVETARTLSHRFEVEDRVSFMQTTFRPDCVPTADAYYLFNPFEENLFDEEGWIDDVVDHTPERFLADVEATRRLLRVVPQGSHVLTYHGFGGGIPPGFEEIHHSGRRPALLRLWQRTRPLMIVSSHASPANTRR